MRLCFPLGASRLLLLSLALLCSAPRSVTSSPRAPAAPPPSLESALLLLQAALGGPRAERLVRPAHWPEDPRLKPWAEEEEEEEEEMEEETPWEEEEVLLRAQRGDLGARLLSPFPGGFSLESMSYQDGGDVEDGGKRNEALTSIAGGLQAVSREKGGFGFRFGRKRWTGRGWRD
ncbi:uncharacterized protein qrfp [Centropristis striata]|uniref:uncharacterized protein qrfp n=1 Tax=Centropristis striata TaxID=184440 RepID=UPI0027DFA26A|nr:uncharacterized protein qrfp [Centropristis striata]